MKKEVFLITCSLLFHCIVSAQTGIAAVVVGGRVIKEIINDFEQTATRITQNAQTTGDALAAKIGNELHVATQNLNFALGQNIDKTFNALSLQEQGLFKELNDMIAVVNYGVNSISSLSELTNLDLIDFTNRVSVLTKHIDFYISSVNGTTVVNSDSDYPLQIAGLGFGLNDSRHSYVTSVYVNNILIPSLNLDFTKRRLMIVNIPNKVLKPVFKEDSLSLVSVRIVASVTQPKGFFGKKKTTTYTDSFQVTGLPLVGGHITYSEVIAEDSLDTKSDTTSISRSFQDCSTDHPCEMVEESRVADDKRIVKVYYDCAGQCGWSYKKRTNIPGDQYAADYDILEDGHRVVVYRHLDGGLPTTVTYYVVYKKVVQKYVTINHPDVIKLQYGQPVDIHMSSQNANCNYSISGTLSNHKPIKFNNNSTGISPYLKFVSVGKTGNSCTATFQLVTP